MVFGRNSLDLKVNMRMINFRVHLISHDTTKISLIVFIVFKILYDDSIFKCKWISKVKNILDDCGLSYLWHDAGQMNPKYLKLMIERRLSDMELQRWHEKLQSNPLCDSYKLFKTDFTFEPYLIMLRPAERICLSKFQCGNHKLPISERRYDHKNVPRQCTL